MAIKSHGTLNFSDDSLVLPNDSGKGLRLGRSDEEGDEWGWRDITSDVTVRGIPATDPTFTQVGATSFRFYRFAIGKGCWFNYHVPHDYVPNSAVHFHVHWFVDNSVSPTSGSVTWRWTYAYAKGFDQEAFDFSLAHSPLDTASTVQVTQASGTPFQHMIAETGPVLIPGMSEPDGMICVYLERVSNGTSPLNELSSAPFMITSDVHYQSTNMATKQKSPNFYAD